MHNNARPHDQPLVPPEDMVNASELREFLYCERAWFLSRQGFWVSAEALSQRHAGTIFHEAGRGGKPGAEPVGFLVGRHSRRRRYRDPDRGSMPGWQMTLMPACIAAGLLLAAVFLFLKARAQRRLGGLPDGDLIYIDDVARDCPVLMSHRYGLKGKPDALVRAKSGDLIPVERKKTRAPQHRPYDGDLIQAAAYCLLVEEEFGRAPPFMRIQYADRWFDEPYTPERKQWVLETCERLRRAGRQGDCPRSHRIPAKCRKCGQRSNCGQSL